MGFWTQRTTMKTDLDTRSGFLDTEQNCPVSRSVKTDLDTRSGFLDTENDHEDRPGHKKWLSGHRAKLSSFTLRKVPLPVRSMRAGGKSRRSLTYPNRFNLHISSSDVSLQSSHLSHTLLRATHCKRHQQTGVTRLGKSGTIIMRVYCFQR